MNNLVSVIITTCNRDFCILERAIKSVINQTYKNIEIIVVDDNGDVKFDIENKIKKYNQIQYYKNNTNLGVSEARNKGIELSKGEFLAFLDDDDEWIENKIELQIQGFSNVEPSTGMIYSNHYNYYEKTKVMKLVKPIAINGDGLTVYLEKGNYILFPLIRRECFDKVGLFDSNIYRSEDYEICLRILTKYKIKYIDEATVVYHIHNNNKSSNKEEFIKANIAIEKKHDELLKKYPIGRYNMLMSRAKAYAYIKNVHEAYKCYFTALKYAKLKKISSSIIVFLLINYRLLKDFERN